MIGIKGSKVLLRPLQREDFDVFYTLQNSYELWYFTEDEPYKPKSKESFKEVFEKLLKPKENFYIFAIEVNGKCIGEVGANVRNGIGKVFITILKEEQSKGYGKDSLNVFVNYAFKEIGVRKLEGEIFEFNERSINLFKELNFKEEGRRRKVVFRDGK